MVRRNTNQRKIVFDSLEYLGHSTSEILIKYIQSNYENISLATIYRNLNILESKGLIKRLGLDGLEIYETVKQNHFHFVCTVCKNIKDISLSDVEASLTSISTINGNTVKSFDLAFYGICDKCNCK